MGIAIGVLQSLLRTLSIRGNIPMYCDRPELFLKGSFAVPSPKTAQKRAQCEACRFPPAPVETSAGLGFRV